MNKIGLTFIFLTVVASLANAHSRENDGLTVDSDVYASHTNLMPYRGYQDDLSATLYLRYGDNKLMPFVRALGTNFNYLAPPATNYISDFRTAYGIGLDYKLYDFLRFRIIEEQVHNKLANDTYKQDSYGIIYNQYLEFTFFDLNNYLETFYIPRFSIGSASTFVRIQAVRNYYLSYDSTASNAAYPFIQWKAKFNDDAIFGIPGQNASIGGGYKIYVTSDNKKINFSALIELHSIFYQSKDFEGDWVQSLAALQWMIN